MRIFTRILVCLAVAAVLASLPAFGQSVPFRFCSFPARRRERDGRRPRRVLVDEGDDPVCRNALHLELDLSGLPALDFSKPLNESLGWVKSLKVATSSPAGCTCNVASDLRLDFLSQSWRMVISVTPSSPGVLLVAADWNGDEPSLALHRVQVGGVVPQPDPPPGPDQPPGPTPKVTQVTYVYEKSLHQIPSQVAASLNRLNRLGVLATAFEQDSLTAAGQIPAQYRVALEAARGAGLPCLVVEGGGKVIRVKVKPLTDADVTEAVK